MNSRLNINCSNFITPEHTIQMLKKNKSINLSVATSIPKSPSMEIVNEGNIFEPRKDPKL